MQIICSLICIFKKVFMNPFARIICKIVAFCGDLVGLALPYSFCKKVNYLGREFVSRWVCASFGFDRSNHFGRNVAINGPQCITLGLNNQFFDHVMLGTWPSRNQNGTPQLIIGNGCRFADYCHITCLNHISIGNGVLAGRFVLISDNSHGKTTEEELDEKPAKRRLYSKGPVIIGDNVWIGNNVSILANVEIGEGAIIGANSVVTRNIPPYTIAAGVPAQVIRKLKDIE